MFDDILNEREQAIIMLRRGGKTCKEIGKMYELSQGRIRQIYMNALEKLRTAKKIQKDNVVLIRACRTYGWSWPELFRLYSILEKNDIEYSWWRLDKEQLSGMRGLGKKYVDLLVYASKNHPFQKRR